MAASYVRLRGIPFSASDQELAQWFQTAPGGPITVIRVHFTFNALGRKSGEAYVELPENMAERAVQALNHRHMGSRYIEVFMSSEEEAATATAAQAMQTQQQVAGQGAAPQWQEAGTGSAGIVRLRGLPFNGTPESILQFFQGFNIPNGLMDIHMVLGPNGRPNGEAYVDFGSEDVADAALSKDRATIGSRYVEVFRATPEQMNQALSRTNKSNNLAPVPGMQPGMQQVAGTPGMPFGYGAFSMPAPMAYGAGAMAAPGVVDSVIKMRGLPYKVTRNEILEFFTGLSVPLNGIHLMFNDREQPTGEAYVEFSSPDDRERAMAKDRQHMGGRYVELFRVSRAEMLQALEQFVGGYMSSQNIQMPGGMGGGAFPGMYGAMQGAPYGSAGFMGGPGCGGPGGYGAMAHQVMQPGMQPGVVGQSATGKAGTLRMRGLPFRSTVDDIFRFFTGFQIMPGGIVIGQRDGRASGEAWVTFTSPTEAQRAMQNMNHKNMGSRYVELFAA